MSLAEMEVVMARACDDIFRRLDLYRDLRDELDDLNESDAVDECEAIEMKLSELLSSFKESDFEFKVPAKKRRVDVD
jgi:hypothetical protein